ncbi:hypothetical protein LzC2_18500 [Planctomycetes bacterium LzC2]|uniref:YscD cytoplasmic domain-containing protein n=2 Tax=Alienimonas chondri TaxID=2681879 RepID=A0ABX1VEC3_9PLAN|nr:hypothetical protein [Alienimonas chondri]
MISLQTEDGRVREFDGDEVVLGGPASNGKSADVPLGDARGGPRVSLRKVAGRWMATASGTEVRVGEKSGRTVWLSPGDALEFAGHTVGFLGERATPGGAAVASSPESKSRRGADPDERAGVESPSSSTAPPPGRADDDASIASSPQPAKPSAKRWLVPTIAGCAVAALSLGALAVVAAAWLLGGDDDADSPSAVAQGDVLWVGGVRSGNRYPVCSAAAIGPRTLATAGGPGGYLQRILASEEDEEVRVFGAALPAAGVAVERITLHPRYDASAPNARASIAADVAVLHLAEGIPITPAVAGAPTDGFRKGSPVTIRGWRVGGAEDAPAAVDALNPEPESFELAAEAGGADRNAEGEPGFPAFLVALENAMPGVVGSGVYDEAGRLIGVVAAGGEELAVVPADRLADLPGE